MSGTGSWRLGSVELGRRPVVAAVVSDRDLIGGDVQGWAQADVLELRVDRFEEGSRDRVEAVTRAALETGRGVLLTVRDRDEGGEATLDDTQRFELYAAGTGAHAFDVEIRSEGLWERIRTIQGRGERLMIGSFHDFQTTPSRDELESLWARGRTLGAHVVKVACRIRGRDDLQRLAAFTTRHCAEGVITLGMGPWGPLSRIMTPALGSLLAYGFIGETVAPGQLSVADLAREFGRWYPSEDP